MPDSIPPPLSVFNTGSTPLIPAFELEMSGGTVTRLSPIRVQYIPPSAGVAATRAINTTAPLAGGGDLSVDRTHTVDTAAVVTSGRTISTLFPIAGGGDLSANRTVSVNTAFLVTTARTISAGAGLTGGGDLSADRTISLATPVVVPSGGTGATTLAAFGVLYGSGASAIQALPAMSAGTLLVGSGVTTAPFQLGSGATGQMFISTGGVVGNVAWINTAAAGAAAPTYPIIVSSGGTGVATLTNRGVLIGSGTSAVQVLGAMTVGQLLVGSNAALAPQFLNIGSQGDVLRIDSAGALNVVWSNGSMVSGGADVTAQETTTSTTYTDLATSGPAVTLSTGTTRNHVIKGKHAGSISNAASTAFYSVAIAGAAAADVDAIENVSTTRLTKGGLVIYAAAVATNSTHTAKYRVDGNTGTWVNRRLVAFTA